MLDSLRSHTHKDTPQAGQASPGRPPAERLGSGIARYWRLGAIVAAVVFLAAAAIIASMQSVYEATARIRIDPNVRPSSSRERSSGVTTEVIETEIGVIRSLDTAREVALRLRLFADPEFGRSSGVPEGLTQEDKLNVVARRVQDSVTVDRDRISYIVAITARSTDRRKAASVANGFARTYLNNRTGAVIETAVAPLDPAPPQKSLLWLAALLVSLGSGVAAALVARLLSPSITSAEQFESASRSP